MGGDKKNIFNNGAGGGGGLPAEAMELVVSLKEIVKHKSYTDAEIYAALRDCHMDPCDAVQKLLAQDTFQEVKSKRERRKEVKGSQEPMVPSSNSTFGRGFQFCHYTPNRSSATQSNYNSELSKAGVHKRDIGQTGPSPLCSSTSTTYQAQQPIVHKASPLSEPPAHVDNRGQKVGWGTTKGNLSMADVVRKGLQTSHETAKPRGTNQDNKCLPVIEHQIDTSDNAQSYLSGDDNQQAALDLHQLNLGKESVADDNNLLVFPNNLQTLAADCSGLNFGTYNSGISSAPQVNLQDESATRVEPEQLKHDNPNANVRRENIPTSSSVKDLNFKQIYEQISKPTVSIKVDRNAKNIHPYLLEEMDQYPGGMPAHVFSAIVSALKSRYCEHPSPLLAKQAMPQIYNNAVSSMSGATLPISEVDGFSVFSSDWQPYNPASSFAPSTAFQPHLSAQANTQHLSSQRELVNNALYHSMADNYSSLEQSYANSHAFAGMNNYPQHIVGAAAMNSLPYSNNANTSGYRNFGISANTTPMGSLAVDYADTLHCQYNNGNNFSLQRQNDNSGTWRGYTADSKAMPGISADTYFKSPAGGSRYHYHQQQGQYPAQQYGVGGSGGYYPS